MAKTLKLGDSLALPLTAVTETFGILAVRGAGKSNLAAVMAEQMFLAGLPFVVIDPVGAWYGLRAGADGSKDGGLAIPIFGGKHGDVPLERHGGELLADLIVSKRLSCVIDMSAFESESAKKAFLLDFARRLYLKNEDPLHLFLEEADDYIPQRPMRDEAQLLRAWENIVRRGRSRGLGMTIITQRSASVSKSVLTQIGTLFVLRTTSPQDRAAIEAWVKYHQTDDNVLASLSSLNPGEAWAWSPQFLQVMQRFQAHRRRTFDSGATPKNLRGKDAKPAATLADVDLSALTEQMAATVERAKANDVGELKKRITELEADARKAAQKAASSTPNAAQTLSKAPSEVLTDADRALAAKLIEQLTDLQVRLKSPARVDTDLQAAVTAAFERHADLIAARHTGVQERFLAAFNGARIQKLIEKLERVSAPAPVSNLRKTRPPAAHLTNAPRSAAKLNLSVGQSDATVGNLGRAERALLAAVASREPKTSTKQQVAVLSGYSITSSSFSNALGRLRTLGLIEGGSDAIRITQSGLQNGPFDPLPTGPALVDYWCGQLGRAESTMLRLIAQEPDDAFSKEELAATSGYSVTSSSFSNAIGKLRTLELVTKGWPVRASAELFA